EPLRPVARVQNELLEFLDEVLKENVLHRERALKHDLVELTVDREHSARGAAAEQIGLQQRLEHRFAAARRYDPDRTGDEDRVALVGRGFDVDLDAAVEDQAA